MPLARRRWDGSLWYNSFLEKKNVMWGITTRFLLQLAEETLINARTPAEIHGNARYDTVGSIRV